MLHIVFRHATDRFGNRRRGQFAAILDGQQLCISPRPLQAAANVLINAGYDPETPIAARPCEADFDTLTMSLGDAASWRIEESGNVSALSRSAPLAGSAA